MNATPPNLIEADGLSMHHRLSELSGGEQQRVAIARALVHRPRPTSSRREPSPCYAKPVP